MIIGGGRRWTAMKSGLIAAIILGGGIATNGAAQTPPTQFEITILSSRPGTVTGGDALAQVRVPASTPLNQVAVKLNGQDVTGVFRAVDAFTLQGLVTGL